MMQLVRYSSPSSNYNTVIKDAAFAFYRALALAPSGR